MTTTRALIAAEIERCRAVPTDSSLLAQTVAAARSDALQWVLSILPPDAPSPDRERVALREQIARIIYGEIPEGIGYPFDDPCAPTQVAYRKADAIIALATPPQSAPFFDYEARGRAAIAQIPLLGEPDPSPTDAEIKAGVQAMFSGEDRGLNPKEIVSDIYRAMTSVDPEAFSQAAAEAGAKL